MARTEIPGFYYDASKGKFFKIQANHLATGAVHSRQNVQTQARIAEIQNERSSQKRKWLQGKVDRPALQCISRLRTKLGTSPLNNADFVINFYATNLGVQELYAKPGRTFTSLAVSSDEKLYVSYAYSGEAVLQTRDALPVTLSSAQRHSNLAAYHALLEYQYSPMIRYHPSCMPDQSRMLAAAYGSWWGMGYVSEKLLSFESLIADVHAQKPISRDNHPDHLMFDEGGEIAPASVEVAVWDMSSAPLLENSAEPPRLALASSAGLHVVEPRRDGRLNRSPRPILSSKEQMTVTFKDHDVVMSGQRDGVVNFSDCRVAEAGIARLKHSGGGVTGIVPTKNDSIIIVSGFDGTSSYDLRYVQAPRAKTQVKHRRKNKHYECAVPLQRFRIPPERTTDHYAPGKRLAYSATLDLCVIASGRTNLGLANRNHVTLYQASTGRMLNSKINDHDHNAGGDVLGVGIEKLRDGPESVVVLQERAVQEWNIIDTSGPEYDGGISSKQQKRGKCSKPNR